MKDGKVSLTGFLRENGCLLLLTLLAPGIFVVVFALYNLTMQPFLYACLLYGVLWLGVWLFLLHRWYTEHGARKQLFASLACGGGCYPEERTLADADYHTMLREMEDNMRRLTDNALRMQQDAQQYYTLWVHQIKTPIAAMRVQLQAAETPDVTLLETELLRIEQYAEMALHYIRLESETSDLSFRLQPLDDIIRASIRKMAPLFIARRLKLQYEGTEVEVLTDGKWLGFILEQVLSNAVKYTPKGTVSITVTDDLDLCIRDTGIGIAAEDIPRVFENGYTGQNGRRDQKATGLGLYLCKLAAAKMGNDIRVKSTVGVGTTVTIQLAKKSVPVE